MVAMVTPIFSLMWSLRCSSMEYPSLPLIKYWRKILETGSQRGFSDLPQLCSNWNFIIYPKTLLKQRNEFIIIQLWNELQIQNNLSHWWSNWMGQQFIITIILFSTCDDCHFIYPRKMCLWINLHINTDWMNTWLLIAFIMYKYSQEN